MVLGSPRGCNLGVFFENFDRSKSRENQSWRHSVSILAGGVELWQVFGDPYSVGRRRLALRRERKQRRALGRERQGRGKGWMEEEARGISAPLWLSSRFWCRQICFTHDTNWFQKHD